jgi:beta-xylosidase
MKKSLLVILSILAVMPAIGQQVGYFTNPAIRGDVADPTVISFKGKYYAAGTSSEWAPHYPVFESKDLVNWTQVGHIFNERPAWTSNSFWAPELFVHPSGKVFCYYTARRKDNGVSYVGVASAKSPRHEFTDHGPIIEYGTEAIDAYVFEDNGQLYISWKAYGLDRRPIEILGSKLSADGLRLEGDPFTMLRDDERLGMEGQYHFKRGDWWYIVYAAKGCCGPRSDYDVRVARSRNVEGSYEKFAGNPILYGGTGDFMSCGHGTGVETPDGRIFYMCHSYLSGDGFYMGRQPILQEMRVNDAGWVEFVGGELATANQPAPFAGTVQEPLTDFVDEFKGSKLKVDWTWNYPESDVNASVQKSNLVLSGKPTESNDYGSVACLRAQSLDYSYETLPVGSRESTQGLTMYGDARNLVMFGVQGSGLFVRVVDNGEEETLFETTLDAAAALPHLKIEVERGCVLSFSYSADGTEWIRIPIEPLDRSKLVRWDRVARPGVIHVGDETAPARFADFRMRF